MKYEGNRLKPLSEIARLANMDLSEVYRRFRLPTSPAPEARISTVNHWDTDVALRFLTQG